MSLPSSHCLKLLYALLLLLIVSPWAQGQVVPEENKTFNVPLNATEIRAFELITPDDLSVDQVVQVDDSVKEVVFRLQGKSEFDVASFQQNREDML